MKKLFSLLLVTVLVAASAQAQVTLKPHVGVNFTDFSINSSDGSASGKAGFLGGLSVAFGKKIYIEPGLQYVAKSTEVITSDDPAYEGTYDIKGFRVPVALGINLLGSQKSTITLHGFGGLSAFFVTSDNAPVALNNTNFGVFAGAGIDFWKLFMDVSYEWSLSNIQEDVSSIDIGKTRNIFINAGLRINLKGK
jgi:hypothetical protein